MAKAETFSGYHFLGNDHCEKILYVTEYVESGSKVRGS